MIESLKAKEISDSKGIPTVEVELKTDFGIFFASVPSGVSTGKYEAVELRDQDNKGVKKAIKNIETVIFSALKNEGMGDQKRIDEILIKLDGTKNKSKLGANAILPVSIAVCRAGAAQRNLPLYSYIKEISYSDGKNLPFPSFNMLEGGKHAENGLAFQEFMAVFQAGNFRENLEAGKEFYGKLGEILYAECGKENVQLSKEGAFDAPLKNVQEALDFMVLAAGKLGYKNDLKIVIDAAATEFFEGGRYNVNGKNFLKEELANFYLELIQKYPIIALEDPFSEEDIEGWKSFKTKAMEKKPELVIIGDDLTVTNLERIKFAKGKDACNGMIIKPNQIGTVSETISAAKLAKSFGWKLMVSNRAGETQDSFIADLAMGISADFIKTGAPFPKERMAKYDRLVEIENE